MTIERSIFQGLLEYFRKAKGGLLSVQTAMLTTLPYLFGIGALRNEVTEQYPDPVSSRSADDLPPRSRGLLSNDINKCTGCRDCITACPSRCIHLITEPGPDETKPWVSVYEIDFGKCVFCGLCVEVCEPKSLLHTKEYEGAVFSHQEFKAQFGKGFVTDGIKRRWESIQKTDRFSV